MKLQLAFLLCLIMASQCLGQSSDFYDKVLSDKGNHSSFIAIDIASSEYKGRVIIQNGSLLIFLYETKGLAEKDYQAFMKAHLLDKLRLDVGDASLSKWGFMKVVDVSSVRKQASKGIEEFIRYYFRAVGNERNALTNRLFVIKNGISDNERNAIINKLFEWGIASRTDDETGLLVVYR